MGGYNSGPYSFWGKTPKKSVESCRNIDIRRWQREKYLNEWTYYFRWIWTDVDDGQEKASIGVYANNKEVCLKYTVSDSSTHTRQGISYSICLSWSKCNYGGNRAWFICPKCGNRVAKLYIKSIFFYCRSCNNLNYRSSQTSGNIIEKINRQVIKIQDTLLYKHDISSYWIPKPKGMHQNTYVELIKQYQDLYDKRQALFAQKMKDLL